MIITIPVRVAGDQWCNRSEVVELLATATDYSMVELDIGSEGASLQRLGVVKTVLESGISADCVIVDKWPNSVEVIPFQRKVQHLASHFFWQKNLHLIANTFPNKTKNLFGLFVGRRTVSRCRILYDVFNQYNSLSCLSLMKTHNPLPWQNNDFVEVENLNSWTADIDLDNFLSWWSNPPISSLDGHNINDQYREGCDTNRDLLAFYDQFDLELVCESYCYGDTFFPTEKTVRPIAAGKSFVTFGPINFLKRLRALGFQTFEKFWDESYDRFEGIARWQKMKQSLEYIHTQSLKDSSFFQQLNSVVEHNRQQLKSIVKKYQPQ